MRAAASLKIADLEGSDPHAALAAARAVAPVVWVEELGAWLVLTRFLALAVMRDPETFTVDDPRFSTAQVVGPSMLSRDGAEHARHRSPFARAFRLGAVREELGAFTHEEAARLAAALGPDRAELRRELAGPLAVAVVAHALGLADAEPADVLRIYDAIVSGVAGVSTGAPVPEAAHVAFAELSERVASAAARAHDAGAPTLLAAAAGRGELAVDEVVANAAVIMFGGIETTEGMIANLLAHLGADEEQRALVGADPSLLDGAVEESLRLEPSVALVDRYATRDVELAGATIGAGELVSVSVTAANRDPEVFADPDRFDARRPDAGRQVAFAAGPHVCPGMHLARLEARAAVSALHAAHPGWRPDRAAPSAPRGLVFRKPPRVDVLL